MESSVSIVHQDDNIRLAADGRLVRINRRFGPYQDPRWQKRRLEIMQRDGFACVNCKCEDRPLNVHHKNYTSTPWGAADEDLQTLCDNCHILLGRTPRGGIWYEKGGVIAVGHCPECGSSSVAANDRDVLCLRCNHKVTPIAAAKVGMSRQLAFEFRGKMAPSAGAAARNRMVS